MDKKKILIIEDDITLAETIKNFLKLNNFAVAHANNGAAGIQLAFSSSFDAIICDINIPVVDGYQVYAILNKSPLTYSIPFIFLTAKTSLQDIRKGMQIGADDYLTKPFELGDLLDAVKTRIGKRQKLLKANEERFQSLLSSTPHGVFVCQENKFIEVNRKAASFLGYSQVEMLQFGLADIVDAESRPKVINAVADALAAHTKEFELDFKARDKYSKPVLLKMIAGYSFYKGKDCIVGSLINLSSHEYALKDIILSSSDLKELGRAIELFSKDYNLISRGLVEKLSGVFSHEGGNDNHVKVELSAREHQVLTEICKGKSTAEIAEALFISDRTVEKHRAAIVQKTGSKNMIEAVIFAIKNRLVEV